MVRLAFPKKEMHKAFSLGTSFGKLHPLIFKDNRAVGKHNMSFINMFSNSLPPPHHPSSLIHDDDDDDDDDNVFLYFVNHDPDEFNLFLLWDSEDYWIREIFANGSWETSVELNNETDPVNFLWSDPEQKTITCEYLSRVVSRKVRCPGKSN